MHQRNLYFILLWPMVSGITFVEKNETLYFTNAEASIMAADQQEALNHSSRIPHYVYYKQATPELRLSVSSIRSKEGNISKTESPGLQTSSSIYSGFGMCAIYFLNTVWHTFPNIL